MLAVGQAGGATEVWCLVGGVVLCALECHWRAQLPKIAGDPSAGLN